MHQQRFVNQHSRACPAGPPCRPSHSNVVRRLIHPPTENILSHPAIQAPCLHPHEQITRSPAQPGLSEAIRRLRDRISGRGRMSKFNPSGMHPQNAQRREGSWQSRVVRRRGMRGTDRRYSAAIERSVLRLVMCESRPARPKPLSTLRTPVLWRSKACRGYSVDCTAQRTEVAVPCGGKPVGTCQVANRSPPRVWQTRLTDSMQ